MEKTPWTRLEGSLLWQEAESQHAVPDWRIFHGMFHPKRLYWHAENTLKFPWCPHLDMAILTHDVIYDGQPFPEQRSADWAKERGASEKTIELILSTEQHVPCADNRMILLDLCNLMLPDRYFEAMSFMQVEFVRRTGLGSEQFRSQTVLYLSDLHNRIDAGMHIEMSEFDRDGFSRILEGISEVVGDLHPRRDFSL